MDAVVGRDGWRRVPVLGLAIVLVGVAMTGASLWDAIDVARGLSGGDRLRVVLFSLPPESCLVAIIGLLLVRATELGSSQSSAAPGRVALIAGRLLGAMFLIDGVAAATDALTRQNGDGSFPTLRGPSALAELSLAALGVVLWHLGAWPARPFAPLSLRAPAETLPNE